MLAAYQGGKVNFLISNIYINISILIKEIQEVIFAMGVPRGQIFYFIYHIGHLAAG